MKKCSGKQIRHLGIHQKYGVVISRLNRAGVELVPTAHTTLQFADVLHMVGKTDILNQAISVIGERQTETVTSTNVASIYWDWLRVILGSIPFYIPGFLWH